MARAGTTVALRSRGCSEEGALMHCGLVPAEFSAAGSLVTGEAASWAEMMRGSCCYSMWCDMLSRALDHLASTFIGRTSLEAAFEKLRRRADA
jgi:hypothetical protein